MYNITIIALAALGVWTAMGEGMILDHLRKMFERLPAFLAKPLATCPRCMVTVYGTGALLVLGMPFEIMHLPAYLLCAVGLQEMLHR